MAVVPVSVQNNQFLKPCSAKRKADEAAAGEKSHPKVCTTAIGSSLGEEAGHATDAVAESDKAAAAAATKGGEAAIGRKKTRLPRDEVDWILTRAVDTSQAPRLFQALRSENPSLMPSPEEMMDKSKVALYTSARLYYKSRASFAEYQAWVLSQLHEKGYVEVDDEAIALRAELRAYSDQARKEAFKDLTFSDSDQE